MVSKTNSIVSNTRNVFLNTMFNISTNCFAYNTKK
jgi:hypothetical protein